MPKTDAAKISVFSSDGVRRVIALTGATLTIGRTPDNDLVLNDPQVSRRHAELHLEEGVVLLTDTGSTNGTFAAGQRLQHDSPLRLSPGVEVRIGNFVLVLQDQDTEPDPLTAEPAPDGNPSGESPPASVAPALPQFTSAVPAGDPPKPGSDEPLTPAPAPLPVGIVSQYLRELPAPLQESDFLGRYLLLFESVWEPMEMRQDHIALYFDPRTCPVTFLPFLAQWVGMELEPHWPERRQRRVLREAAELYRWRGTVYGLVRFVELCIGVAPVVTEVADEPFTIEVVLPPPEGGGSFRDDDRESVRRIIERHKPAHVGYYLRWEERSGAGT